LVGRSTSFAVELSSFVSTGYSRISRIPRAI
jgi:hypothetical protein